MHIEPQTQIGPYRVDALLGQGGMAAVYKVWNGDLHRYEALKMPLAAGQDANFIQRFLSEARKAARLQHPNIATVYAVSDADAPQPYFTMDLLEGEDLAELIHRRGRLPLDEALPILRQIASALDYAHRQDMPHHDINPANILLTPDGSEYIVKVTNFGLSREETVGTRLTQTGTFAGTPEYMSPEQAGSGAPVDHRADQYSLAVVAYDMLCGTSPFKEESEVSPIAILIKQIREEPLPPSRRNPILPPAVDAAILKALSKDPTDRFDSCKEFVEALDVYPSLKRLKALLPNLTDACSICISDNWGGLSPSAPHESRCVLSRHKDQFRGKGTFSVSRLRAVTKRIKIPHAAAVEFLQTLALSPVTVGKYEPTFLFTDSYPSIEIIVSVGDESIRFHTTSQGPGHVPWAVDFNQITFVVDSDNLAKALNRIEGYLRRNVIDRLSIMMELLSFVKNIKRRISFIRVVWAILLLTGVGLVGYGLMRH
jgi:serine/threonine protein kinase